MILVVGVSGQRELAIKKLINTTLPLVLIDVAQSKYSRYFDIRIFLNPRDVNNKELILKKIEEINISDEIKGIITLDELSVLTASYIAEYLKLPFNKPEVASIVRNKYLMRKTFQEAGLLSPKFYPIEHIEELQHSYDLLNKPFVLKPTDSGGSAGVQLIENNNDLYNAFNHSLNSSKTNLLIAEEFIIGREFSVEAIVYNGEIYQVGITEKRTTNGPFFVELGHIFPAKLNKKEEDVINETLINAIKSIGIEQGAVHLEVKLTEEGPVIIEIGGRPAGDYIIDLIELSTGIDFYSAMISCSLGKDPSPYLKNKKHKYSSIIFFTTNPGKVQDITSINKIDNKGLIDFNIEVKKGDSIQQVSANWRRLGYVIHSSESYDKLQLIIKNWHNEFKITSNNESVKE